MVKLIIVMLHILECYIVKKMDDLQPCFLEKNLRNIILREVRRKNVYLRLSLCK